MGAALAVIGLTGCESMHRNSDRTAGREMDDKHITSRVQDALRNEPVYKFSDVDVKTFNGVVQLSGFVNTDDQKQRAGDLAQHVQGVAQVVNSIALKAQTSPTPTGRNESTVQPPPTPAPVNPPPQPTPQQQP